MSEAITALSVNARAALCPILGRFSGLAAPGDVIAALTDGIVELVEVNAAVLFLPEGGLLRAAYAAGSASRHLTGVKIRLGQDTSGAAAVSGTHVRRTGLGCERGVDNSAALAAFRSVLALPLVHNGHTLAVLSLYRRSADPPAGEEICLLDVVCRQAAASLQLALEHEWYRRTSALDRLTGLPNSRELFLRLDAELSRCHRTGACLAILIGRLEGPGLPSEETLARLGLYFRNSCRDYDYVGWTGERFVVLLPGATATRPGLWRGLPDTEPFRLRVASASYPKDGVDAEDLLAAADRRWARPSPTDMR
jgi:GGDEF domain-containing protein